MTGAQSPYVSLQRMLVLLGFDTWTVRAFEQWARKHEIHIYGAGNKKIVDRFEVIAKFTDPTTGATARFPKSMPAVSRPSPASDQSKSIASNGIGAL